MTEHLSAGEHCDQGLLVGELERSFTDHVELGARATALDEHHLAGRHNALDGRLGDAFELALV